MSTQVVIVEDEQASRATLKNYLSSYCADLTVIAEAEHIIEGEQLIKLHQPDIVFLDIEMPFGNAFDLLEKFSDINFEVIFITAYSNYAIQAINMTSCSYLLKPLDIEELKQAVKRSVENIKSRSVINSAEVLLNNIKDNSNKKVVLPRMTGFDIIDLQDVVYCKSNDNLTEFYLNDGRQHTVCKTLKFYEETFKDLGFYRCHKSYLINLSTVTSYQKGKTGEITLNGAINIPLSNTRKEGFMQSIT